MAVVASLAAALGAPEAALRLVFGQLAGYPLLIFYRHHLAHRESNLQHLYFFLSGLLLGHWVLGEGVTHNLYTIGANYLILQLCGGSILSVGLSFILNLSYLLAGYWYNGLVYDMSWTLPQCVLCLRLIGLTWDVYDGRRLKEHPESLSEIQTRSALSTNPNILEMLSHCFFIGGYFVGPQFTMRKYQEMVTSSYQANLPHPGPIGFGMKRLSLGAAYMLLHVVGSQFLPELWPTTTHYEDSSLVLRLLLLPLWCKFILAKYLSLWLMAEGVCVISGLSYIPPTKQEDNGDPDWRGCANVKLRTLESATWFHHYIAAFNINTNDWCMNYVYKRLKFFNSRIVSQCVTLVFLALWHGWHSGYYLTFFNEFIVISFERDFSSTWRKSTKVAGWKDHPAYHTIVTIIGWSYVLFFLPHCFLPFPLLAWSRYWPVYRGLYLIEYLFFLGYPLWGRPVKAWLLNANPPKEVNQTKPLPTENDQTKTTINEEDQTKATVREDQMKHSAQRDEGHSLSSNMDEDKIPDKE